MARVTVEDCVTIIPNRFELVLLASQRARDISAGVPLTVSRDNDKDAVISLREVAEQTIDFEELRRHIVHGVNRHADLNFEDDNILALTEETMSDAIGEASDITEVAFEVEEVAEEKTEEFSADDVFASSEMGEDTVAAAEEDALDTAAADALKALENLDETPSEEEDIPA
ncbi:MAG: DNA-directed RNA polymerase subunit omega [Alphaproteobacteria bacterium]|jgi:DNA-directed RNA polymerase subunit omega